MRKMTILDKMYDVATVEEYKKLGQNVFNPNFTAINIHGQVLPVRTCIDDNRPGVYFSNGPVILVNKPDIEDAKYYSESNIVDYSKPDDIRGIIRNNEIVRDMENEILTDKDNISRFKIGDYDSPALAALKQAINLKEVDMDKYKPRFNQFNNDIRVLTKPENTTITMGKLVDFCNNMDIEAELILRDKPDAPNPMSREVTVNLTDVEKGGDN